MIRNFIDSTKNINQIHIIKSMNKNIKCFIPQNAQRNSCSLTLSEIVKKQHLFIIWNKNIEMKSGFR